MNNFQNEFVSLLDDCQIIIHNERRFFGWTASEKSCHASSSNLGTDHLSNSKPIIDIIEKLKVSVFGLQMGPKDF